MHSSPSSYSIEGSVLLGPTQLSALSHSILLLIPLLELLSIEHIFYILVVVDLMTVPSIYVVLGRMQTKQTSVLISEALQQLLQCSILDNSQLTPLGLGNSTIFLE